MSFELFGYQNRTNDFNGALFQADGVTPFVLAPTDTVRVKIGRGTGSVPVLDLLSGVVTAAGSTVTITSLSPATYSFRIAQGDTATLFQGVYDVEVIQGDSLAVNPAVADRLASIGVLHIVGSMGGNAP